MSGPAPSSCSMDERGPWAPQQPHDPRIRIGVFRERTLTIIKPAQGILPADDRPAVVERVDGIRNADDQEEPPQSHWKPTSAGEKGGMLERHEAHEACFLARRVMGLSALRTVLVRTSEKVSRLVDRGNISH